MPKKTKREKIAAELHRKTLGTVSPEPAYIFQPQSTVAQMVTKPADTAEYRAIKIDLVKTLMLAAIAISVELILARS